MRRVVYISRVVDGLDAVDLRHIAGLAEAFHRRLHLSGVLAYTGSHFIQVIEGAGVDVDTLLDLIRRDARHESMRTLCDELTQRRVFDRWYSLHVASPQIVDQVQLAHVSQTPCADEARQLTELLLKQLRADDLML